MIFFSTGSPLNGPLDNIGFTVLSRLVMNMQCDAQNLERISALCLAFSVSPLGYVIGWHYLIRAETLCVL
jgi:hypothetical protein